MRIAQPFSNRGRVISQTAWTLSVVLAGLLIPGCISAAKRVDKGPVKAHTFNFAPRAPAGSPAIADEREEVHKIVQDAITENLAGKGISRVAAGGDVAVAYLIIIGDQATAESINTYFGYGRSANELHEQAQNNSSTNQVAMYCKPGTLLVDIIDSQNYEVIRRNYVVRPALGDPSAAVQAARIQEAVDAVLKGLRVTN
jgi:hypothetical protein